MKKDKPVSKIIEAKTWLNEYGKIKGYIIYYNIETGKITSHILK